MALTLATAQGEEKECSTGNIRVCRVCGEEKELALFPWAKKPHRRRVCQACTNKRKEAWEEKNPEKVRRHWDSANARARALRHAFKGSGGSIDIMRRALVEHPPELGSEGESLAYFRGFIAGAQRSAEETSRFERLKDLCHRIASEHPRFYEERLTFGYEGLLVFMRKRPVGGYKSETAERSAAAQAIRWAITDGIRQEGPTNQKGRVRHTELVLSELEHPDGSPQEFAAALEDFSPDFRVVLNARLDERIEEEGGETRLKHLKEIVNGRLDGFTFKEMGEKLGFTESRACQIFNEEIPWMSAHLAPLALEAS